jgi:hypothetical protein
LGEFYCGLSFAFIDVLTLRHFIDCTQNREAKIAELLSVELVFHLHREGFLPVLDDSMIAAMAACGVALPSTVTFEEIEEMFQRNWVLLE